ncbi:hypothetical protein LSTR_LSTR014256 [Laodelphax striatellus]|uniref:Uncharacterized protein n=1 Tax=Laodelphax striatellus TaxID=195883 RepID=A0A482X710_LAOST|nr:hypothetical protein LSTR_LSTR005159 [Laodelphax striatellus]RZF41180.1 hypothetical protein LSTR_LSTR014256 [Laodelphax striatellus]
MRRRVRKRRRRWWRKRRRRRKDVPEFSGTICGWKRVQEKKEEGCRVLDQKECSLAGRNWLSTYHSQNWLSHQKPPGKYKHESAEADLFPACGHQLRID